MREEKQKVESDLNALKLAFDLALESNGNDSQLLILFKIKEENEEDKNNNSILDETNDEEDEETTKTINEMNKLKDNIINKKNDLFEIINKNKENNGKKNEYSNIYNLCKNADFNFVEN